MYKLPPDLIEYFKKRLYRSSIKKNIQASETVLSLVSWAENIDEAITAIKQDIHKRPLCPICNTPLKIINNNGEFTYNKGCSIAHAIKASNLSKYGVKNVFQLESTIAKSKKTNLKKYGMEYHQQTDIGKQVRKDNCLQKYGVDNLFKAEPIKQKIKDTMLRKYGVNHPMFSEKIKDKLSQTMLKQYGETNIFKTQKFKDNLLKHNIEKFGVSHPNQNPEEFERRQHIMFKRKEYSWKTGEISLVQGYEPIVLKELEEQGYKFEEVLTSPKDMPKIMYQLNEKEHRYYPDIFIPKDNIIIEVKSDYTLNKEWDKNQAKFEATKSLGFDFRLEVR